MLGFTIKGNATLEGADLLKVSMKKEKEASLRRRGGSGLYILTGLLDLIRLD